MEAGGAGHAGADAAGGELTGGAELTGGVGAAGLGDESVRGRASVRSVSAAAAGVRRGARVVVVAPYEGPLRDATAGRSVALAPRVWVADEFGLARYLAAGLATLHVVDPGLRVDLAALADELDAEAFRNSAGRELFTNPAKTLADRMSGREVVVAGDTAPTLALARHGAAALLRIAHKAATAVGLADALVALRSSGMGGAPAASSIFHDEQIDGPLPPRTRTFVLATDAERPVVVARVNGLDDVDIINAEDVPEQQDISGSSASSAAPDAAVPTGPGRIEQQLAMLAVRLEMTAVYLKLIRG